MTGDLGSLWRRLLVFVDVLVAVGGCFAVIVLYVNPGVFGDWDAAEKTLRVDVYGSPTFDLVVIGCVVLLLLNLLRAFSRRRPARPLHHLPSEMPGGMLRIERGALEAGLRAAAEDLDVINRARIAVEQDGQRRYVVRAFFQCPDGVAIVDASEALRAALGERFHDMVRLPDGARVAFEIEFVGFAGKPVKRAEPAPQPVSEPEPFRGPQYPIDDDEFEEPPPR